jgi:hypothetical protein
MEPNVPAVVGEIEAGRAAKVRREINKLVKGVSTNTFDLAELLFEAKSKAYYSPDFESFSKYAKSLDIKYTKCYYLVAIVSNMYAADLKRAQYEPIGLVKLRAISRLKATGEYKEVPMPLVIRELTLKAGQMTPEEVTAEVDAILGLTEDESFVWLNIKMKKLARENAVKPALALAKKHMPESQTKDPETGVYIDPSDGAALEMICANFLADPNFNPTETTVDPAPEVDDDPATDDETVAEADLQDQ